MAKGKDKPSKQTKKPKSDKPKGSGSSYQQVKGERQKGLVMTDPKRFHGNGRSSSKGPENPSQNYTL